MTETSHFKSVDLGYDCCRRHYFYGLHSKLCLQTNQLTDEEYKRQIKTAPYIPGHEND